MPHEVKGPRQKGAYFQGMKDCYAGETSCKWDAGRMFNYWMKGRKFAALCNLDCSKGFKEMLADWNCLRHPQEQASP